MNQLITADHPANCRMAAGLIQIGVTNRICTGQTPSRVVMLLLLMITI